MGRKILTNLEKYVKHIDTNRYGDYIINDNYFSKDNSFKIESEMRLICDSIFQRQHQITAKLRINLCKHSSYIYHVNILIIIDIVYHIILIMDDITWHVDKIKVGLMKFNLQIKK